jgi:hypothetical protein
MNRWLSLGGWLLFFLYLHLFYYALLVPAFAEYSYYAFLFVPLAVLGFLLVPKPRRRQAAVLSLLYIFADQAFTNVRLEGTAMLIITAVVLFVFLSLLTRWYAGIRWPYVACAVALALIIQSVVPVRTMQTLTEMRPLWVSEPQYLGEFFGHLPFNVADVDGDGRDEIVTLGNRDFYPDGRILPQGYELYDEPTRGMAWEWRDGAMRRLPEEALDLASMDEWLPHEYIGYPYYVVNDELEIEPLVARIPWATGLVQFGTAPFRAMTLNLANIERQLAMTDGVYDRLREGGQYRDLAIRTGGVLTGEYAGKPFTFPTSATQISDVVRMPDGSDALLLKGYNIELMQIVGGEPTVTHVLTRTMQRDLSYSNLRADDVDGDGADEVIIAYPYPAILKPAADGRWEILWAVDDRRNINISFQIKDLANFHPDKPEENEIVAFSKSRVRASQTNYLTGFTYTPDGLKQKWKVFARGLDVVKAGDLDGDGKDELIATFAGSSQIYVFAKHDIPVTSIAIVLTIALFAGLLGRRVFDAAKQRRHGA